MSDTTDLIQRLRDIGEKTFDDWDSAHEAADALEQQAAQIAEKDAEISRLISTKEHIRKEINAMIGRVEDDAVLIEALRADAERLMAVTEETANMLRGMCMDPRIQKDIKEALWSRVRKLDKATEDVIDAALRQELPKGEGA